jgi:RecA-family ATPase
MNDAPFTSANDHLDELASAVEHATTPAEARELALKTIERMKRDMREGFIEQAVIEDKIDDALVLAGLDDDARDDIMNEVSLKLADLLIKDPPRGNGGEPPKDEPLPYLTRDMPLHDREWAIVDRVPMRNVTLVSGDGGVGKTVVLMQLAAATALGKQWLGMCPMVGPVLYLGAEDDGDELRRRFEAIAKHYSTTWKDLFDVGLRVLSFAGLDALLGKPDRDGLIVGTPLLERVRLDLIALHPKLFIVDPAADMFAGKEVDRAQVRQFITLLRGVAIAANCAIILAAHPSLTGMREGTGLSGSTAWGNSVRARFYLTKPKTKPKTNGDSGDDDDAPDNGLRVLQSKKSNYGPLTASIPIRWENGVFVVAAKNAFDETVAEAMAEEVFMMLLRRFSAQGRSVGPNRSSNYAPIKFAEQPEAKEKKITKDEFAAAQERLLAADRIKVVPDGPPSRRRDRLVEASPASPSNGPSNTPSNGLPTPSNGVCSHTPLIPPSPLEAGKGALEAQPAPTGEKEGTGAGENNDSLPPVAEVLGVAAGQRCELCGAGRDVYLIRLREGEEAAPMHRDCAVRLWTRRQDGE